MSDTSKATPRPWRTEAEIRGDYDGPYAQWVKTADDRQTIAACVYGYSEEERVANAALIVQAVNAFDAMRDGLVSARAYVHVVDCKKNIDSDLCKLLTAALALAAAEGKVE